MNYTKGKWYVEVSRESTSVESESQTICTEVSNCDADLISASPDMYEALKEMLNIFDRGFPTEGSIGRTTCDEAIKAIKKAEGK